MRNLIIGLVIGAITNPALSAIDETSGKPETFKPPPNESTDLYIGIIWVVAVFIVVTIAIIIDNVVGKKELESNSNNEE